jgi:hypothetical protein
MKKMISAAFIVAGILLLYFGYQEYQSLSSEVEEFFTGSPNSNAMWMMIGGAAAIAAGIAGLLHKKS